MGLALCIYGAGKASVLAASLFSLSWQHSVQKTEWRESWSVVPAGLQLLEARVKGSGAGMEPPEGSILEDGWWVYRPDLPPQESIALAASGATGSGWQLCVEKECLDLGESEGEPVVLRACEG